MKRLIVLFLAVLFVGCASLKATWEESQNMTTGENIISMLNSYPLPSACDCKCVTEYVKAELDRAGVENRIATGLVYCGDEITPISETEWHAWNVEILPNGENILDAYSTSPDSCYHEVKL